MGSDAIAWGMGAETEYTIGAMPPLCRVRSVCACMMLAAWKSTCEEFMVRV